MTVVSWNGPPLDLPLLQDKPIDHRIDDLLGLLVGLRGQKGVFGGGQDGAMPQNSLDFKQVDTRFNQMSGITGVPTVRGDLFFILQSATT